MSEMYVDEHSLEKIHDFMIFRFPSQQVGDEALALEIFNAADGDDEKVRISAARKLQIALSKFVYEGEVGPPYSIFLEGADVIHLVVLPGFNVGHRVYVFLYHKAQPLEFREIWYSHARCFSPIDVNKIVSLKIPANDLARWREEILKVMEARYAPRGGFFFPKSAV
jgi:hypothetical protein